MYRFAATAGIKLSKAGRLTIRWRGIVWVIGGLVAHVRSWVEHGSCASTVTTATAAATTAAAEAAIGSEGKDNDPDHYAGDGRPSVERQYGFILGE